MEPNRRRARVRQGMLARTPSASRAGLLARLRQQDQARHQQVTKHLRQTRETQKFEAHRPQWQVSWRLENVSVARAGMGLQYRSVCFHVGALNVSWLRIPIGMRRPAAARETLC